MDQNRTIDMPQYEGVPVTLNGREYLIPPLNFKQLRVLLSQQKLAKIADLAQGGVPSLEQLETLVEVSYSAFKRNYPSISMDDFEDMIDLGNVASVFQAVVNISGLEKKKPGEVKA